MGKACDAVLTAGNKDVPLRFSRHFNRTLEISNATKTKYMTIQKMSVSFKVKVEENRFNKKYILKAPSQRPHGDVENEVRSQTRKSRKMTKNCYG